MKDNSEEAFNIYIKVRESLKSYLIENIGKVKEYHAGEKKPTGGHEFLVLPSNSQFLFTIHSDNGIHNQNSW